MKYFSVKKSGDQLVLKKNKKGLLHQRIVVVISVVSLSFALSVTLYYSVPALKDSKNSMFLMLACIIILFSTIFFSIFFEKKRIISVSGDAIKVNDKYIEKSSIVKIQTRNYVSSELVSDSINIRLVTLTGDILIASGVKNVDIDELVKVITDFIGMRNLEVENIIH
jgi:hypothetical protein